MLVYKLSKCASAVTVKFFTEAYVSLGPFSVTHPGSYVFKKPNRWLEDFHFGIKSCQNSFILNAIPETLLFLSL